MLSGRAIGITLAAVGTTLFGTKAIFIKLAYDFDVGAATLITLRMAFAAPFYLGVLIWALGRGPALGWPEVRGAIIMGLIGYYLASYLDFLGLLYISAQLERIILFSYPTLIVFATAVQSRALPNSRTLIALLLTYIGIALVFGRDVTSAASSQEVLIGASLVFGAAIAYASYIMRSKGLMARMGSARFTSISMLAASAGVLLHSLVSHQTGLSTLDFDQPAAVYGYAIAIAIFSTILPSYLIADAVHRLTPTIVAIIGNLGPVATSIMAVFVLGEAFTVFHAVGFSLVICGVSLMAAPRKRSVSGP